MAPATLTARPGSPLKGRVKAPGDKSISHRALILGALASGETLIEGLLEGDDVLATARAMVAFGATVEHLGVGRWRVLGAGGLKEPTDIIDCGNSGTGVRLMMGAAAGFPLSVAFTGDASLRGRPMMRAGLNGAGMTEVVEPEATRDHTERMLRAFGAEVSVEDRADGRHIRLAGGQSLTGCTIRVPGDPSSAAFPLVAALITPGSAVMVEGVLLNPLRTGLFKTLIEMGADLTIENAREEGGEQVGDVTARYGPLRGVDVPPERAPSMIDEYPILAVAAAFADGETMMRGLGELIVKESDRLAMTVQGLSACGVVVEQEGAAMKVRGAAGGNHRVRGAARVATHGDHRIAMAHLMLGLAAEQAVSVDEPGMIATSFPGFPELMRGLGAEIEAA